MIRLFLSAILVAAFSWPLPVLAHVPQIGDRGWFTMLCKEDAHNTLIELAQTKGLNMVEDKFRRFVNSSKCFGLLPPAPAHIIAVAEPVYTPNGNFVIYPLSVQLDVDGPPSIWFAAHSMPVEIEGEPI